MGGGYFRLGHCNVVNYTVPPKYGFCCKDKPRDQYFATPSIQWQRRLAPWPVSGGWVRARPSGRKCQDGHFGLNVSNFYFFEKFANWCCETVSRGCAAAKRCLGVVVHRTPRHPRKPQAFRNTPTRDTVSQHHNLETRFRSTTWQISQKNRNS